MFEAMRESVSGIKHPAFRGFLISLDELQAGEVEEALRFETDIRGFEFGYATDAEFCVRFHRDKANGVGARDELLH